MDTDRAAAQMRTEGTPMLHAVAGFLESIAHRQARPWRALDAESVEWAEQIARAYLTTTEQ